MTTLGARAFGAFETRQSLTDPQIDGIARELLAQLSLEEKFGMIRRHSLFSRRFGCSRQAWPMIWAQQSS